MERGELEEKLVYSVIVAGKNARFADRAIGRLKDTLPENLTFFEWFRALRCASGVMFYLREAKTGRYEALALCFWKLAHSDINLETCSPEDLEIFRGIGPKTSRFFILWTRPGARYAALDRHILKWFRDNGRPAPLNTPSSGPLYAKLEQEFIAEADLRGVTPRELDWQIWTEYSRYAGDTQTRD